MDLKEMIEEWIQLDYIKPEDVPNIELYMDQITTFMDSHLGGSKRYEGDKTLTKTMINNYTKNNLMPPPNKKKYSKNHIYLLIYIYYLKNFLSIGDIQKLLTPLTEKFYKASEHDEINFAKIYKELLTLEHEHYYELKDSIFDTMNFANQAFQDLEKEEDQEFLRNFALITLLSYDIYMKKQLVERMIDNLYTPHKNDTDSDK